MEKQSFVVADAFPSQIARITMPPAPVMLKPTPPPVPQLQTAQSMHPSPPVAMSKDIPLPPWPVTKHLSQMNPKALLETKRIEVPRQFFTVTLRTFLDPVF